jgi:hypothetical protein
MRHGGDDVPLKNNVRYQKPPLYANAIHRDNLPFLITPFTTTGLKYLLFIMYSSITIIFQKLLISSGNLHFATGG